MCTIPTITEEFTRTAYTIITIFMASITSNPIDWLSLYSATYFNQTYQMQLQFNTCIDWSNQEDTSF